MSITMLDDIEAGKKINLGNRRITIIAVADDFVISFGSGQAIISTF